VFCIHFISGVGAGGDSRWVIPTAVSIYTHCDTDLNEYPDLLKQWDYYCCDDVNGHYYSFFPIGTTVMALPFVLASDLALRGALWLFPGLEGRIRAMSPHPIGEVTILTVASRVEWLAACTIVALTTLLLFRLARQQLSVQRALFLALIFAFATPAWSTASRAMLQHGPMMLLLAATLVLFVEAERKPWLVQFAGITLAYGYVVRPTGSIPLALLSIYVFVKHRRYAAAYVAWALLVIGALFAYHYSIYGVILPPYYRAGRLGHSPYLWEALAGNWISPARGLLVFTPIFLFSFVGIMLKLRRKTFSLLDALLCGVALLHWVAISAFPHWWGGHSYGPRYFSDVVPIFIYFLIPVLEASPAAVPVLRRRAWATAFGLCLALSFLVNMHGATDMAAYNWNWDPVPIDQHPERLWSWSDPQFLRGWQPRKNAPAGNAPHWENARMDREAQQAR
jgi:hypothetical protein